MSKINKIVFSIILTICLLIIFAIYFIDHKNNYKLIDSIIDTVLESEKVEVVYLTSSDCNECELQKYQIKLLIKEYNLDCYYIDLSDVVKSKQKEIYEKLALDSETITPTIAIYDKGEIKSSLTGITGINRLYDLLQNSNVLEDKELPLNYLNTTSFASKLEEDKIVLALGTYMVSDSNSFEEMLWDITANYDIEINFLHLADLSESEAKLFEQKIYNISEYEIDIPAILIIEKGYIKNILVGLLEQEDYVEFLKENGII